MCATGNGSAVTVCMCALRRYTHTWAVSFLVQLMRERKQFRAQFCVEPVISAALRQQPDILTIVVAIITII